LGDESTYPGKVRTALHAAYMQMKFKTHRDVLTNARACLDAVAAALLSVVGPSAAGRVGSIHHHQNEAEPLPSLPRLFVDTGEDVGVDTAVEAVVCNAVDQYMLGLCGRSMYSKLLSTRHHPAPCLAIRPLSLPGLLFHSL